LTSAELVYIGPGGSPRKTLTVTGPQLAELATAINALKVLPPGAIWNCPMDNGEHAVLTPSTHGHTQAFDIELMGCRFVPVSVDGTAGHTLMGDGKAQDLVRDLLGVQLPPSTPPGASTPSRG